jgi:putative PEP-CTERM system TPR-repeat lipoprotein
MSLASGKREQALEYFAQAASSSAGSEATDVQLEVANGYMLAGDYAQAVAVLEKLPATTGAGYQREYLLMVALLRMGENERAVAEAQALVKRAGSDPQARVLAAGVFASTGRLDEARRELGEALKLKPDDAATVVNLARIDLLEGKTAAAEQGFRKALASDPKNLQAMLGMAAAAGSRNDRIEARKWLQQASTSHPDSVEAQLAVGQYYAGTRDFEHSKAVLDAAVEKWPDNAVVVNARGLAQLGLGDAAGAVTSFKQATTLAPKAYGFMMNLAGAHAAGGNIDGALAVLNDLLRAQPAYVPALTLAARLTLGTGQVEKAAGYVARLRNSAPEAANTHALEGDLAMAQKRYRDALQDYRKASASGMTSQLALAQYEAARRAGEPKPEQILVDWVARNPGDGAAVIALAEARHGAGDVDGAIALYERSVEVLPANAALLNNLAVLYDRKGDPRAADFAERANQAAPNSPPIQDTYGWILFRQGKTGRAVELLRAAHKGLPDNAEVQYHLAAVLAEQGDTAAAVELLKKAVRGPIPEDQKVAAQQLLQKLSN